MPPRLVVIGDVLLDVDVETTADRLVPDSAAPVLEQQGREERPGGAGLAATLAALSDDVDVTLIAPLPECESATVVGDLLPGRLTVRALPSRGETPVKLRLRCRGQTVARLDSGTSGAEIEFVPPEVEDAVRGASAVLVSDYGGATARHEGIRSLLQAQASRCPVVWDPHPRGAVPVHGVQLVTPNQTEAARLSGLGVGGSLREVRQQAALLIDAWQARGVVVTRGSDGAVLCTDDGNLRLFPATPVAHVDVCGAGDSFAAATAIALARGSLPTEAVAAGVSGATRFVQTGGVASLRHKGSGLRVPQCTATPPASTDHRRTVVATGGCFDLLHAGHIHTLAAARSLGDYLVVLLNSDESVRRLKGNDRPFQSQSDRAMVLRSLRDVDEVVVFDEDTPERALSRLRPDVWVKGGDYASVDLPEASLVRSWGGEVLTVPYLPGRSTTNLARLVGA